MVNIISGRPREALFFGTFRNCSGITGSIPGELFAEISGATGLSDYDQIPDNWK